MFILSFLEQIQLRLIADDDLMTAVQCPDAGRVHFVRITEIDAMKVSAEEETDRIHRTVRHRRTTHACCHDKRCVPSYPPGNPRHRNAAWRSYVWYITDF